VGNGNVEGGVRMKSKRGRTTKHFPGVNADKGGPPIAKTRMYAQKKRDMRGVKGKREKEGKAS